MCMMLSNIILQNRTEQNRTEQNRTEQNRKVRRIFTNGKSLYLFRNMNGYEINTIIKFKGAKGYGKEKNCG